jgi:Domain of unknown function (DUF4337)
MHSHEIQEQVERAHARQRNAIGLTTTVVAVLLALATMMGNVANTNRIVIETKTADWWAYSHSNDTNSRIYMANERLAILQGQDSAAKEFHGLYEAQKRDSENAQGVAQSLEKESALQSRHGLYSEIAVLCLEVSIVLCSIALLTNLMYFWRLSFITTTISVGFMVAFLLF